MMKNLKSGTLGRGFLIACALSTVLALPLQAHAQSAGASPSTKNASLDFLSDNAVPIGSGVIQIGLSGTLQDRVEEKINPFLQNYFASSELRAARGNSNLASSHLFWAYDDGRYNLSDLNLSDRARPDDIRDAIAGKARRDSGLANATARVERARAEMETLAKTVPTRTKQRRIIAARKALTNANAIPGSSAEKTSAISKAKTDLELAKNLPARAASEATIINLRASARSNYLYARAEEDLIRHASYIPKLYTRGFHATDDVLMRAQNVALRTQEAKVATGKLESVLAKESLARKWASKGARSAATFAPIFMFFNGGSQLLLSAFDGVERINNLTLDQPMIISGTAINRKYNSVVGPLPAVAQEIRQNFAGTPASAPAK